MVLLFYEINILSIFCLVELFRFLSRRKVFKVLTEFHLWFGVYVKSIRNLIKNYK